MPGSRLRLASILAVLALPASGEPIQHGHMVMDVPEGWTVARHLDPILLLRFNDHFRCYNCVVRIGPGEQARGSLAEWADQDLGSCLRDEDRDEQFDLTYQQTSTDGLGQFMRIESDGSIYAHSAFHKLERFHSLCFRGEFNDERSYKWIDNVIRRDLSSLLASLRFASEDSGSLLPPPVPGGLSGLYWGWAVYPANLVGIPQSKIIYRNLVFFPDGHFFNGTPPDGIRRLDPAALTGWDTSNWGTYREAGGPIELTFADGKKETLLRNETGLEFNGVKLTKVEPVPDNTVLAGSARETDLTSMNTGTGGFTSLNTTCRWFWEDGTYEDVKRTISSGTTGGPSGGGLSYGRAGEIRTSGTYRIQDGLIITDPDGPGQTVRELALITPDGDIFLGGFMFTQEDDPICPR